MWWSSVMQSEGSIVQCWPYTLHSDLGRVVHPLLFVKKEMGNHSSHLIHRHHFLCNLKRFASVEVVYYLFLSVCKPSISHLSVSSTDRDEVSVRSASASGYLWIFDAIFVFNQCMIICCWYMGEKWSHVGRFLDVIRFLIWPNNYQRTSQSSVPFLMPVLNFDISSNHPVVYTCIFAWSWAWEGEKNAWRVFGGQQSGRNENFFTFTFL